MPSKSSTLADLTPFAAVNVSQILRQTAALTAIAKRFRAHGRIKTATYDKVVAKIEAAEQAIRDAVEAWQQG